MSTPEYQRWVGPALARLVEHPSFIALNSTDPKKQAHYIVNADKRILIKFATNKGPKFQFNLLPSDVTVLEQDQLDGSATYLVLVCGKTAICVVSVADLWAHVADPDLGKQQIVLVEAKPKHSLRVWGPRGRLPKPVSRNAYPKLVLD